MPSLSFRIFSVCNFVMPGSNSPFGAKPTQVCVFASKLAKPHIVFGSCEAPI